MLEPVFLYRASKCKNPKNRAVKTVYGLKLLPLYVIIIVFFPVKTQICKEKQMALYQT